MRIRALRGVCIGVNRHLQPGDIADLDTAMVIFLKGIGAVEEVSEQESAPGGTEQPLAREKTAKKEKEK